MNVAARPRKQKTRAKKFANAERVLREFRRKYPSNRPLPDPMVVKISAWEMLPRGVSTDRGPRGTKMLATDSESPMPARSRAH